MPLFFPLLIIPFLFIFSCLKKLAQTKYRFKGV